MKGIQGLIVAVGLGLVAALLNWTYLNTRSEDVEKVGFIGIDPKVTVIGRGELLKEEHLVEIGIPKQTVGKLSDFGVPYSAKETVIGQPVWRTLSGGMLLLAEDLKTPPHELRLADDEKAMWIPVETRAFVPSLITPGDLVSFIVTRSQATPTPAVPGAVKTPGKTLGPTTIIGPFKILSLGNRLGSAEVMRAAKIPQVQEHVMTVAVKVANGQLDSKAQELWNALQATDFRQMGVLLHEHRMNKS